MADEEEEGEEGAGGAGPLHRMGELQPRIRWRTPIASSQGGEAEGFDRWEK